MENIYQLLSNYNFTIITRNIDEFKCAICKNILINACQAICGCNFCRHCANAYVTVGKMFCPGNTEECQTANLSNVTTDNRINRQISQLMVKCAEQSCNYECPLKSMEEHLRFCPKKSVSCPFNRVGCDGRTMSGDILNEHMQTESRRHSEILIDLIGNLRNEMAELRCNMETNNFKIDNLEKNNRENSVIIESMNDEIKLMNEEIKSIKLEKAALERQVTELMDILDDKMDKCDEAQQIDIVTANVEGERNDGTVMEIDVKFDEMKQEWRKTLQLAVADISERIDKYRIEEAERIFGVEKCLAGKIDAGFVWTIDDIDKEKNEYIYSEYFYGGSEQYKMQLGYLSWVNNKLYIRLFTHAGESDENLQWPFHRNVTITITNQKSPNKRRAITQRCQIRKPESNSCKFSDAFIFDYTYLSNEGLLLGNCVVVQCNIHDGL